MTPPKKRFSLNRLNRLASPSNFLPAIRNLSCAALLLFEVVAGSTPASAQTSTLYRLNKDSTFQQGCFPPCLCPIMIAVPVEGTFVLTPTGFDGLFDTYAVTDVNWLVSIGGTNAVSRNQNDDLREPPGMLRHRLRGERLASAARPNPPLPSARRQHVPA